MGLKIGQRVKAVKQITNGRNTPGNPNAVRTLANEGDMGIVMGAESEGGMIDVRFDGKFKDITILENEVVWVPQKKKKKNPRWKREIDELDGEIAKKREELEALEVSIECARINYTTDGLLDKVCELIKEDCTRRADNAVDAARLVARGLELIHEAEPEDESEE